MHIIYNEPINNLFFQFFYGNIRQQIVIKIK